MRPALPLAWIAFAACAPAELFVPVPGEAKSMILALDRGTELDVEAIDLSQPFTGPAGGRVTMTALLYPFTLSELHLTAGRILGQSGESQPLSATPYQGIFRATVDGHTLSSWRTLDQLEEPLLSFQVPAFGALTCAMAGGCVSGTQGVCKLPCGEPMAPQAPSAPLAPAAPRLTPCPGGWTEVPQVGTATLCAPNDPPARVSCPADQAQFFGDSACTTIGTDCPADGWPAHLPTGPVLYARAGAGGGGDGSLARPFATLSDALRSAMPGTVVALAVGDYHEAVQIDGSTVVGACAQSTQIHGSDPAGRGTVFFGPAGGGLQNVTVSGDFDCVTTNDFMPPSTITLSDLSIIASTGIGVRNAGQRMIASKVVVRSPTDLPVWLIGQGTNLIDRMVIEGGKGAMLALGRGTTATITQLAVRSDPAIAPGSVPLALDSGARADVRGAVLEGYGLVGILAQGTLALDAITIRDGDGEGVHVYGGGSARIQRSHLARLGFTGIDVTGSTTSAELDQLALEDFGRSRGVAGSGISVSQGAQVSLTRSSIANCHDAGLYQSGGAIVIASDLAIDDCFFALSVEGGSLDATRVASTGGQESVVLTGGSQSKIQDLIGVGATGEAIRIVEAATGLLTRLRIDRSSAAAIEVRSGTARIIDLTILDPQAGGSELTAVNASVTLARASFGSGNGVEDSAIAVAGVGTTLSGTDLLIANVSGPGLVSKLNAVTTLTRVRVRDSGGEGLLVDNATLNASDLEISGSGLLRRSSGFHALPRGIASLTRFRIHDDHDSGAAVEVGASFDLHDGRIGPEQTGVHVFDALYDPFRLLDQVLFEDVATAIAPD